MLEILCKVSFFLSMLVAYTYVTSTNKVIVIVSVYSLCVFSYYNFNVIRSVIDDFFKFINFNEKFNGYINSSQVPIPYVNPVESASYHNIKYPSLRQMSNYRFDKSTLRHLSKVPRINSTSVVRIAPPEPTSINHLNDKYITNNDRYNEGIKNDKYLQVLREISRKRNYQEESDRIDSTSKKSRRNDIRNFTTSHSKRSHDDSSYDHFEDTSRKKRCSDSDRSVAKILSYTSSLMHVVAPNFTWNNISKKRKSSRIEKSTNESPEKVEKVRKINHKEITEDVENHCDEQIPDNRTYVVEKQTVPVEVHENSEFQIINADECDSHSIYEPPLPDDDGEYVKVASGKILNRTNRMYRKKLNSNRIDPQSVITLEPELVNSYSSEDDEAMKNTLIRNLIDDIERKGEKDESVIFYENSIVEEIAKNRNKIESTKLDVIPNNASPSTFNPLLSKLTPLTDAENKSAFGSSSASGSSIQSTLIPKQLDLPSSIAFETNSTNTPIKPNCDSTGISSTMFNSSVLNHSTFNANLVDSSTFNASPNSNSFAFESNNIQGGVDTVDSLSKSNPSKPEEKKEQNETTRANVSINDAVSSMASAVTTTTVACSPKSEFLLSGAASAASSNAFATLANSTSMVNSPSFNVSVSSTQQNSTNNTVNTTKSEAPVITFGTATASPFSLGAKNNVAKIDSSSSIPQVGNAFATSDSTIKPAENVQKSSLSSITMFGNTAISTSASGTSNSNTIFTSSTTVPSFTNTTPSSGYHFGQSSTPNTNASAGFSFASSTTSSHDGLTLGTTTSVPAYFSVPTSAFVTASTSSSGITPTLSVASSTPATFSAGVGLKFEAKPSQPATSFSTSLFNASTTTTCSPVPPSVPSFSDSQNTTFGLKTGGAGFGTSSNPAQGNTAFGNTSSTQPSVFGAVSTSSLSFQNTSTRPQTNSTFGNATAQSNSTFGSSPAPANSTFSNATTQSNSIFGTSQPPAFAAAQNTMFGSGDPATFSQNTKPAFGTPNPSQSQFGSGTAFTFGTTTTNAQSTPPAFGNTSVTTPFGNSGAAPPPSFNSAATFNFNASGSSSFVGNVFGATAAKPADNAFTFGSGNVASTPAPVQQNVFQFGTAPQSQAQPFTFGANSGTGTTTGGFSIGAGGSSRNRANRNRRK